MQRTYTTPTNPVDVRDHGAKFFADLLEKSSNGEGTPGMCMAAAGMGIALIVEIDRLRNIINGDDKTLP